MSVTHANKKDDFPPKIIIVHCFAVGQFPEIVTFGMSVTHVL